MNSLPVLSGISLAGAAIGFLGGRANQVLVASVSPVGYAIAFGLTPIITYGMYSVTNEVNAVASCIFSPLAGYMLSAAVANILGCKISLVGPFTGIFSLAGSALIITLAAIPLIALAGLVYLSVRR